jgi:hypothetical protein
MLTEDSHNLVKIVHSNMKKVKKSNELNKLYDFLYDYKQNLDNYHINYFHKRSKKKYMIKKEKHIPDTISEKSYVLKYYESKITSRDKNITLKIHSNDFVDSSINLLHNIIHFVCNLAPSNTKTIEINLYLLNHKKLINMYKSSFTKNEINSGFCRNGLFESSITIYRKEELIKVLIHELIHALKYDYRDDPLEVVNFYKERYNIYSEKVNSYEAYTELWANLINCFLISQLHNRNQKSMFYVLIRLEADFCEVQKDKVFFKSKLSEKLIDINQQTNVLAYFIIRCELYQEELFNEFLKFCRMNNENYVKMTKKEDFFKKVLLNKKKNKFLKKNNRRFNNVNNKKHYFKNMRMSINELNIKHE